MMEQKNKAVTVEKKVYEIDGNSFSTVDEFFDEISKNLIPNVEWGHNFNAFDDILYGGFGTPEEGFILRWKNSKVSQQRLGYPERIRLLELWIKNGHPSNREKFVQELAEAKAHRGDTIYDWLLEIIRGHSDIELELH